MTDNIENMTLIFLRRIDERLDRIEGDMSDIKLRMTTTEEHLGSMMLSIAGINARMDKVDGRLSRVERRLHLTDAG